MFKKRPEFFGSAPERLAVRPASNRLGIFCLMLLACSIGIGPAASADDLMSWPSEGNSPSAQGTGNTKTGGDASDQAGAGSRSPAADASIIDFPEGGSAAAERMKMKSSEAAAAPAVVDERASLDRSNGTGRPSAGDPAGTRSQKPESAHQRGKSITLFGRIDQIAAEGNVQMPELKMQQAMLDPRQKGRTLRSAASESIFSGHVADSFPIDFSGTWGGTIRVWRYAASPLSFEIDSAESRKMQEILSPGTAGDVNFVFQNGPGGDIALEPAQVRILIPARQSYSYEKMMGTGGNLGSMGPMVSQMMADMKIPVILHFGTVSTAGSMEVGVSGNQIDQRVVKNEIRQLAPNVMEEQIVTRNRSIQASGRAEDGYTESVLRFTRQSPTQLYVLAASVDYSASGKYLRKLIMYGNVIRGQVMDTSPYPPSMGNLSQMVQSMQGNGAMSGYSSLLNSLGAASGGATNYGSANGLSSYMNNPAVREYLNGNNGQSSHLEGFSQILNNLNMLSQ